MPSDASAWGFGDVVLVRFPFTNQVRFKQRPAVVISNAEYSRTRPDVILMAVTSQMDSALSAGDMHIAEWQAAGLLKPSAVKPVFATVEQVAIVRRLGALGLDDVTGLREAIIHVIG